SCVQSSASAGTPVMRRQRPYTRAACSRYSASKARVSAFLARAIHSCSSAGTTWLIAAGALALPPPAVRRASNDPCSSCFVTWMHPGHGWFKGREAPPVRGPRPGTAPRHYETGSSIMRVAFVGAARKGRRHRQKNNHVIHRSRCVRRNRGGGPGDG